MTDPQAAPVEQHYERHDESARLSTGEGHVELLRTQEILRAALPPAPARVLDVGGADGAHAAWLQEDGYDVEIVDVVPRHVALARARGFDAAVGDARALAYADDRVDAVLLLGPLYHLVDRDERMQALREAGRVVRPGGLLAAAAVSRTAVVLDWLRTGSLAEPERREVVERIVAVGRDDTGWGGGAFYFHTVAELRREIVEAGFSDIEIRGVEGPGWPLIDRSCPPDDPRVAQVLEVARLADAEPDAAGASAHLLALARA